MSWLMIYLWSSMVCAVLLISITLYLEQRITPKTLFLSLITASIPIVAEGFILSALPLLWDTFTKRNSEFLNKNIM